MFSKFFIHKPIFSTVLSFIIVIIGIISIKGLPVEEYPQVTPPQVSVTATYVGASAETVSKTIAAPLEEQINGIENMMYMSSTSSSDGTVTINVYFKIGTDIDKATIDVNNRVQMALSNLPSEVQSQGVNVAKQSSSILMMISLLSPNNTHDELYISNFANINIVDELKRIPGVGNTMLFSNREYSMRVWLKPDQLAKYNLSPTDIINAISEQNAEAPIGSFNETPSTSSQAYTFKVKSSGRLQKVSEFENIILKYNSDGSSLKLKNVARVELGSNSYSGHTIQNSQTTVPIGINLQSGANALGTAKLIKEKMKELSTSFPKDITYNIPYDTTKFIEISVQEVIKTFIEALLLVIIIVYLFLQNMRATIIPILAIPVSIIGTFAGMYLLGYSINLLTLFGLVLSIGIVVDDAIIVVENVERILHSNKNITVKEATIQAMSEITKPVIAIVLVLSAVFIPVSFMGGFTGAMYQQFAITIVISVVISGFVALTLTPALCNIFIKKIEPKPFWIVKRFNDFFDKSTNWFSNGVNLVIRHSLISMLIFGVLIGATYQLFQKVPSSLVPLEDKGYLIASATLPVASSLDRTIDVGRQMSEITKNIPEIENSIIISGFGMFGGGGSHTSTSFFTLKPWSERLRHDQSADSISNMLNGAFYEIPDATIFTLSAPPIDGLSNSSGFEMYLQDKSGGSLDSLNDVVNKIVEKASTRPELSMVRSSFDISIPQYQIILNKEKAKALGVSISEVYKTLQVTLGSYYVNDFNLFGKAYKVNIQAESSFREKPDDLNLLFVKSESGKYIPISSLVTIKREIGANNLDRFNALTSARIDGEASLGYSSGQALQAIEEVVKEVAPRGYNIAWAGTSYQEKAMKGNSTQAFLLALLFIFLILAAQYERWLMPLAVITVVPFAVFGAILAVYLRDLQNDIYFQIGLLVLIGLSAKNAILIVEFAMQAQEKGKSILEATLEASRLRFRPIIMTSLAFTIGVLPLAISSGAGAGSRHAIGTGVIGGMIASTTIAVFFIPLFYYILAKINAKFMNKGVNNEA